MKRNITLRIEKDLIRKAKVLAAQQGTSVSQLLANHLTRMLQEEDTYEAARKHALATLKHGFDFGIGEKIPWTREDLHER